MKKFVLLSILMLSSMALAGVGIIPGKLSPGNKTPFGPLFGTYTVSDCSTKTLQDTINNAATSDPDKIVTINFTGAGCPNPVSWMNIGSYGAGYTYPNTGNYIAASSASGKRWYINYNSDGAGLNIRADYPPQGFQHSGFLVTGEYGVAPGTATTCPYGEGGSMATLNNRGAWTASPAPAYALNDMVTYKFKYWSCNVATCTSGAGHEPDATGNTQWTERYACPAVTINMGGTHFQWNQDIQTGLNGIFYFTGSLSNPIVTRTNGYHIYNGTFEYLLNPSVSGDPAGSHRVCGTRWIVSDTTAGSQDHITYDNSLIGASCTLQFFQVQDGGDLGLWSWQNNYPYDDIFSTFSEDSTETGRADPTGGAVDTNDASYGAKIVVRHTDFTNAMTYQHGMDSSSSLGGLSQVDYFNTYCNNSNTFYQMGGVRHALQLSFHNLQKPPASGCSNSTFRGYGWQVYRANSTTSDISTWPIALDWLNWGVVGSVQPYYTYGYMPLVSCPEYQTNHTYAAHSCVSINNTATNPYDALYVTVNGGTTGASAPASWPHYNSTTIIPWQTVTDSGGVTWTYTNAIALRGYQLNYFYQQHPAFSASFNVVIQPSNTDCSLGANCNPGGYVFSCATDGTNHYCDGTRSSGGTLPTGQWPQVKGNALTDAVGQVWTNRGKPQQYSSTNRDQLCDYGSGGSCTAFMDQDTGTSFRVRDQAGRCPNGQGLCPVIVADIQCGAAFGSSPCTTSTTPAISASAGFVFENDGNPSGANLFVNNQDFFIPSTGACTSGGAMKGLLANLPVSGTCYYYATDDGSQGSIHHIVSGVDVAADKYTPFVYPHPNQSEEAVSYTLTVANSPGAGGTVTSSPVGINCGATCNASFSGGTVVTLSAVASGGYTFTGWSGGGCSGTGTCVVTMNADTSVTASYSLDSAGPSGMSQGVGASPGASIR